MNSITDNKVLSVQVHRIFLVTKLKSDDCMNCYKIMCFFSMDQKLQSQSVIKCTTLPAFHVNAIHLLWFLSTLMKSSSSFNFLFSFYCVCFSVHKRMSNWTRLSSTVWRVHFICSKTVSFWMLVIKCEKNAI